MKIDWKLFHAWKKREHQAELRRCVMDFYLGEATKVQMGNGTYMMLPKALVQDLYKYFLARLDHEYVLTPRETPAQFKAWHEQMVMKK